MIQRWTPARIKVGRYMHAEMMTRLHGKPVYVICGREQYRSERELA